MQNVIQNLKRRYKCGRYNKAKAVRAELEQRHESSEYYISTFNPLHHFLNLYSGGGRATG